MTFAEDVSRRIAANLATAEQLSAQSGSVAAQLAQLTGRATSARREVTVEVDHRGIVSDLVLSEAATALGIAGLRSMVFTVTQNAIADLRAQARPIQAQLVVDPAEIVYQNVAFSELDELLSQFTGKPTQTQPPSRASWSPPQSGWLPR